MQTFSRLTDIFSPTHYDLSLTLEREARIFSGTVTIRGELHNTDYLPLHAKDLTITQATIDGTTVDFTSHEHDELRLVAADLSTGEHDVTLEFSGTITDAMHGLYPCYFEVDGVKKELLATQFESHHAREVFPCVDEPAAKATFDLTLTTEKDVIVLGNMPHATQTTADDYLVTTFQTTPKMSCYLLAWVTGDLQKKTATTKDGVEVNVWATPTQPAESLDFALTTAVDCIEFYNDYFGTAYPLPKCDHVALPDFSSGAMENWGLITYREVALLAGKNSSIGSRRYIATVICHELSHQWFGNLVTMNWWDDLWLNESFATLMEYIAVDSLHPKWHMWREFSSTEGIMALRRDALDGVQSVHVNVEHPDEISTLFDGAIVYAKGARLMRMAQQYVGEEAFQAGLQSYFAAHAYSNTVGDDLWQALSQASGKPVADFMNTWISQPGYPLVTIETDADSSTLSQQQFFIGEHAESTRTWPIPLHATSSAVPDLLDAAKVVVADTTPFRLNDSDTGHFITKYPSTFLDDFIAQLRQGLLDDITRLQLLHEQTLLAKSGDISTADLLPLIGAYSNETNETVWGIIGLAIAEIRRIVEDDSERETNLKELVGNMVATQYSRLGWQRQDSEPEDDTTLRGHIISLALYAENQEAIHTAHDIYVSTELEDIDPEFRSSVISNEVRHFDPDGQIVTQLLTRYASEIDGDIQQDIATGITSTRRKASIQELIAGMQDPAVIRVQDTIRWFAYLIRGRYSRTITWQWLQENWAWVDKNFSGDKSLDYFPRYAAGGLKTATELEEYKQFFAPLASDPSLTRAIQLGQSEIAARIDQIARDYPQTAAKLDELTRS